MSAPVAPRGTRGNRARGSSRASTRASSSRNGATQRTNGLPPPSKTQQSMRSRSSADRTPQSSRNVASSKRPDQSNSARPKSRVLDDFKSGWRDAATADKNIYKQKMNDLYQTLKENREHERKKAIKDGFLADPDKPTSLANAITPVGTCQDMCPEFERVERIVQLMVDANEKISSASNPESKVPSEDLMVKRFRRSAAGYDEQLPSDIRPPAILKRTLDYLFDSVVGGSEPLAVVHKFVWDRTRGIRNDFSIQQVTKVEDLRIAIDCFERIARFHILSLHILSRSDTDNGEFDHFQEREQLNNTLLSLMYYYDDSRHKMHLPNEAEFRAYCVIFEIQDQRPDLEDRAQSWPSQVLKDPQVKTALKLYSAAGNTSDDQGPLRPRTTFSVAQASPGDFFQLVKSDAVSYMMACVAEMYFNYVRATAIEAIWKACKGNRPGSAKLEDWALADATQALGFDNDEQTWTFCEEHGFEIGERENGESFLNLGSVTRGNLEDTNPRRKQLFSRNYVEQKRYGRSLPAVINGLSVLEAQSQGLTFDSDADDASVANSESLFVTGESDDDGENARSNTYSSSAGPFASNTKPLQNSGAPVTNFGILSSKPGPFQRVQLGSAQAKSAPFATDSPAIDQGTFTSTETPNFGFSHGTNQTTSNVPTASSPFLQTAPTVTISPAPATTEPSSTASNPSASPLAKSQQLFANSATKSNPPTNWTTFGKPSTSNPTTFGKPSSSTLPSENPALSSTSNSTSRIPHDPKPSPSPFTQVSQTEGDSTVAPVANETSPQGIQTHSQGLHPEAPSFTFGQPPISQNASENSLFSHGKKTPATPVYDKSRIDLSPFTSTNQQKNNNTSRSALEPITSSTSFPASNSSRTPSSSDAHILSNLLPTATVDASLLSSSPFDLPDQSKSTTGGLFSSSAQTVSPRTPQLSTAATSLFHPSGSTTVKAIDTAPSPQAFQHAKSGTISKEPQTTSHQHKEAINKIADALILENNGLIEQYIEVTLGPIIKQAMSDFENETSWQLAHAAREILLARKYGRSWHRLAWKLNLARRGRERRQNLLKSMSQSIQRKESKVHDVHADQTISVLQSNLARANSPVSTALEGSPSRKRKSLPGGFDAQMSRALTPSNSTKRKYAEAETASDFGPKSRRNFDHKRSNTIDNPIMSAPPHRMSRLRHRSVIDASKSSNDSLLANTIMKQARHLGSHTKADTTRTDYFRLKALGVNPDTPLVPKTKKMSNGRAEVSSAHDILTTASNPPKTPTTRPPEQSIPTSVEQKQRLVLDKDDDEAFFASIKVIRETLADSTSWFQNERQSLERSMTPQTPSNISASFSERPETPAQRHLREIKERGHTPSRTEIRLRAMGSKAHLPKGFWEGDWAGRSVNAEPAGNGTDPATLEGRGRGFAALTNHATIYNDKANGFIESGTDLLTSQASGATFEDAIEL